MTGRLSARRFASLLLFLIPLLLFHRALFLGEAFLPADQLGHLQPYKTVVSQPEPWNVLRFDGITQFYPWRLEVARQQAQGRLPLRNPYAFAASGGTPLLANSQSAPLYPPNLLFLLCYLIGVFPYAFGLSAALHLLIGIKGTYHYLRALELRRSACLLGATVFGLSGPVITWLALPTFLAVSCWIPWILLLIRRANRRAGTPCGLRNGVGAGAVGGLMLLAGHLQIAFYGLLAAGISLLWEGHIAVRGQKRTTVPRWLLTAVVAGVVLIGVALPQVLPVLELSRISHRAASGPPTMEAYQAFTASAVPVRQLVAFLVPDFFGHPNRNEGFYWNSNNYAEWCGYVGVLPLMLAVFALALPWKGGQHNQERGLFAAILAVTLLIAFGTPINLPLFFLVPGFGQLANPGRILVVAALAFAVLAALGLDALSNPAVTPPAKRRAAVVALILPTLLAAFGANQAAGYAASALPGTSFGPLLTVALPGIGMAVLHLALGAVLLFAGASSPRPFLGPAAVALALTDLFVQGYGYNPTRPAAEVYPVTPGIAWLQANAGNALIAPLNRNWSLYAGRPPVHAVLPPNGLTVYGLHDLAGYDSLFPAESRERVRAAGGEDPAPPENGNMVLVKSVEAARTLRARYLVVPPDAPDLSAAGFESVYAGEDMVIYRNPDGADFAPAPEAGVWPLSFRIGLAAGIVGWLLLIASLLLARRLNPRPSATP
ncbi:MAG: hypothetical protein SFU56_08705 [Capsulimonadales bacterium]|nr:hypothetical protein [Capsulimonadales bacterium]